MADIPEAKRLVAIELLDRYIVVAGDPILDTDEGTLTIFLGDNTFKVYNWRYVCNFYHMTEEETRDYREENKDD